MCPLDQTLDNGEHTLVLTIRRRKAAGGIWAIDIFWLPTLWKGFSLRVLT